MNPLDGLRWLDPSLAENIWICNGQVTVAKKGRVNWAAEPRIWARKKKSSSSFLTGKDMENMGDLW